MLPFIIVGGCSNLFLKELMLSCPIMRRFMLFILISLRKDCGSFISVPVEFVRGELGDNKKKKNQTYSLKRKTSNIFINKFSKISFKNTLAFFIRM